jgi:hypothetical protein
MNNEILKFEDQSSLEKNDQLQEELFKQYEGQIERYSQFIKLGKIVSVIMFLLFLVIFTVNTSLKNGRSWYFVLVPAVLTVISLTVVMNYYLNIQNIFDSLESSEVNIGTVISYFCLNIVSVNLILYLILFCLKLEGIISYPLSLISIPLYIIFGVSFFYFVFILPALIQTELYFEILLIFSYMINIFAFLLVINSKIDNNSNSLLTNIFIPIWIAVSLHLSYISYYVIFKEELIVNYISSYLVLGISTTVSVLLCCKLDNNANIDNWVFGVLCIVAYHFFIMEKIYQFYWKKEYPEGKEDLKQQR